jgi:hypothetical protein
LSVLTKSVGQHLGYLTPTLGGSNILDHDQFSNQLTYEKEMSIGAATLLPLLTPEDKAQHPKLHNWGPFDPLESSLPNQFPHFASTSKSMDTLGDRFLMDNNYMDTEMYDESLFTTFSSQSPHTSTPVTPVSSER